MKIAVYCTTLPQPGRKLGGVEVAVHRLANALVERPDSEVTVLALNERAPEDAKYNYQRLFADWPWLKNKKLARLFVLPALLNIVDMTEFDVVHLQGDDWFYFRRQIPSVRTLNGSALREAQSASSWKRKALQYLLYPLEHLSARLADVPLALGRDTARIYSVKQLIDYGVDCNVFMPGQKASRPRLLFIGTWEGRKRGYFVYETFIKEILPLFPSAELVMACEKDKVPSHPQVHAVGYPSTDELAKLYRESWVFVYPSVYEGFGIPYIEAMASGTAIVASKNIAAEYLLDGGRCGLLVEDHEFGKAVVRLLQAENERKRFEGIGIDRSHYFSWSSIARRHMENYSLAIEKWEAKHIEKAEQ